METFFVFIKNKAFHVPILLVSREIYAVLSLNNQSQSRVSPDSGVCMEDKEYGRRLIYIYGVTWI